ncbi:hypothetical protein PTE30175_01963 [Pandoraea terrae]|uniref:Uncharacterized protein n=1 Tax=Pandoraea terrae TaxID=1537710 RepID=A0A5E4UGR2_9BURK|nr:hypothetical protein [Pandoraea terrae]VVD99180.1 hypothetical protein PTE30175_01963 [Pandoraea terrae]
MTKTHFRMTLARWLVMVLGCMPMLAPAQEATITPRPAFAKDIAEVMEPLPAEFVERCGMTLFYPALETFRDQKIGPGCAGSYKKGLTVMNLSYEYGEDPEERTKSIDIVIKPSGLERRLEQRSSAFAPTVDGVRMRPNAGFGNVCDNLVSTEITPISGVNWHGWMAEEVYSKSRSKEFQCTIYSPTYRCISMLIGNTKMSAHLAGACLLRERTTNLEEGLSYDLFMEMIKSIRFNEE